MPTESQYNTFSASAPKPDVPIAKQVVKGHLSANVVANLASFGVSVVIGLWFTPFLIRHLGTAAYGLIPLATTVTSYLSIITLGLNSAVGRFITIALEQGDEERANRVFNTSFFGSLVLVLLMIPLCLWLAWHSEWLLRVPPGYEADARWLVLCTFASFLLTTIKTPFDVSTFCQNRFDLRNAVDITNRLVQVGLVIVLFYVATPKIWHVGIGIIFATLVSSLGAWYLWRALTPSLHVVRSLFDWRVLKDLTGMGTWVVINQIGSLLYLSIDLIVVNRLLGPLAGGRYGAVMQWSALLRGIAGAIAGVFGPTIIYYYARRDIKGLVDYSRQAVKLLGLAIALPIGLMCGLSRSLLHLWLGPGFVHLAPLMSLMTIHLCINLGVLPLFNIQVATNHVRWPGIVTCVMGICNLGLALLLAGPLGWGMYGVAAAGAIMLTAKNAIFTPLYGAHILGLSHMTFLREMAPIVAATTGVAVICWWLTSKGNIIHLPALLGLASLVSIFYFVSAYHLLLTGTERASVKKLIGGVACRV